MVMPHLLLQKPHHNSKTKHHEWKGGNIANLLTDANLLTEAKSLQEHLHKQLSHQRKNLKSVSGKFAEATNKGLSTLGKDF